MAIIPARIDTSGKIVTNDRKLRLSKSRREQIQWIAEDEGGPWTIVFVPAAYPPAASVKAIQVPTTSDHTPFGSHKFDVPQGGNARSGHAIVPHGSNSYKYEVHDSAGRVTDDPDVLVDP